MSQSADARRLEALLGLALRKRAVVFGRTACRRAAERGRLHLVLVAADAGSSAVRDGGISSNVTSLQVRLDKVELGRMLGRAEIALLGITDPHFAAGLRECARTDGT